jgi:heme A synthase
MNLYNMTLYAHSYMRWAVVILGVLLIVQALIGWLGKRPWDASVGRIGSFFTISMDVQLVLGLLLYGVFSPTVQRAFDNFGSAMGDARLRFWAVEHILVMVVAVVLAHIGQVTAKRLPEEKRYRRYALFAILAMLAVLLAIPWPLSGADPRPLFRV